MPVGVAEPISKRVTQWDEYSGRFEAVASVEVRARVSGFIDKIDFRDGQIVKVGDPLFTIDKRPYEIAVESAEADVARNKAQVELAELQVNRGASLIASRTITEAEQDSRASRRSPSPAPSSSRPRPRCATPSSTSNGPTSRRRSPAASLTARSMPAT